MELIFLLCSFFLFSFMLLKIVTKNTKTLKLPPGPRPLPIIGNMHQLYGGLAHHTLAKLSKKYGPIMHLQLGEVVTIVISSPKAAKEIYKTHDINFSQRPTFSESYRIFTYDFTDIVGAPYGKYWRQLRKIFNMELVSPKRVQTFRFLREEEALNLARSISLEEGCVLNLSRKIFSFTYSLTSRIAFGKRNKSQERFEKLMDEISRLMGGFSIGDFFPSVKIFRVLSGMEHEMKIVMKEVDEILQNILNEHKERMMKEETQSGEVKEDIVDVLLKVQKSGDFEVSLTDINLKAVILDVFSAGSGTSSTTLEWAISETLRNPRVLKRAQEEVRSVYDGRGNIDESKIDELKYVQAIVKETLRLRPSAPLLLPRECGQQCNINGYDIPAKARILVNGWAIARDPEFWNEPEKFNPERFLDSEIDYKGNDFEYIPFGAGRRICPGISYALPNIVLPLAQLLFHFDWKLPNGMQLEDLDMAERMGVSIRRADDLNVIPILYKCSSLKKET